MSTFTHTFVLVLFTFFFIFDIFVTASQSIMSEAVESWSSWLYRVFDTPVWRARTPRRSSAPVPPFRAVHFDAEKPPSPRSPPPSRPREWRIFSRIRGIPVLAAPTPLRHTTSNVLTLAQAMENTAENYWASRGLVCFLESMLEEIGPLTCSVGRDSSTGERNRERKYRQACTTT